MAAAEWLAIFQGENEKNTSIASVADDLHAKKVLAAWSVFPFFKWNPPNEKPPNDPREAWEILWEGFECDWKVFSKRSGVNAIIAEDKWELLMGSRLIYPDGTISKPAMMLLNAFVASCLPKPTSKK